MSNNYVTTNNRKLPTESISFPHWSVIITETYFTERMGFQTQALIYDINQSSLMVAEY